MPQNYTSPTMESEKQSKEERPVLKYSDLEKKQQALWFQRAEDSWNNMNTALDEFDGLSLIQTCQGNRLARNSFLTPIQNDGEVRVVTGTTEGKVDSVFNAVLNQYMEVEVQSYNQFDLEDVMLGDALTKLVKRTGQMENEEDIEAAALDELLTMPAVYIQETNDDEWYYDRVLESGEWADLWEFKEVKFKKEGWYRKREPKKVLWTADQVLLADIRIPARLFQTQPYIIKIRTRTKEDAERVYRNSPRWKYVHAGMPVKPELKGQVESSEWRFNRRLKNDEVEEIIAETVCGDEQQIWLNGVPMLPVGCPYLGNRFGKYNMTMEVMKEIHRKFAYGRPIVSMTKVLQALKDEDFRLMILERRQQIWQPIVTKAQSILSKDMWLPAAITYGVSKSEVETLIDKQPSVDKTMQEMIEREIEKFINVSALFQGLEKGDGTAFQAAQQMKQALIMLGHALVARMRLKRNCTYLRLYNLLQNLLDPIDTRFNDFLGKSEDVYRSYSLRDSDLYDGTVGTEIISFVNRKLLPEEENMVIEMERQSRANGKPVSHTFIPVQKLKSMPSLFYVNVIATEKRNSLIEKEMFKKDIVDSLDLGARVGIPVNPSYVTQEWGKRIKVDPQKLYVMPQVPNISQGGVVPTPGSSNGGTGDMPGKKQLMNASGMQQ